MTLKIILAALAGYVVGQRVFQWCINRVDSHGDLQPWAKVALMPVTTPWDVQDAGDENEKFPVSQGQVVTFFGPGVHKPSLVPATHSVSHAERIEVPTAREGALLSVFGNPVMGGPCAACGQPTFMGFGSGPEKPLQAYCQNQACPAHKVTCEECRGVGGSLNVSE